MLIAGYVSILLLFLKYRLHLTNINISLTSASSLLRSNSSKRSAFIFIFSASSYRFTFTNFYSLSRSSKRSFENFILYRNSFRILSLKLLKFQHMLFLEKLIHPSLLLVFLNSNKLLLRSHSYNCPKLEKILKIKLFKLLQYFKVLNLMQL